MNLWLPSTLLMSIPFSLALAGWWAGTATAPGNRLLALTGILGGVWGVVLMMIQAMPALVPGQLVSLTSLSMIVLGLVLFMGIVLTAFSQNYLRGEQRINDYWRWLFTTLAAVTLVVVSNHLILFLIGWTAISLSLHQLLTFYPERPRAALAAHKKFLLARTAEALLLVAFTLLYQHHGSFLINELMASYTTHTTAVSGAPLSLTEQIAAVFIALAALIKCAQLPVHGWLIQVVEAPTPVSALLHAGVINLGGFLLLLFAPLFMQVPVAQWLVLIIAGLTTVLGALIMTTRVSVKVRLAWSTSAQMGFMLVECALGLYELALLHLLTHSVYKAYAFLNSGNAVNEDILSRLSPTHTPSFWNWLWAGAVATLLVSAAIHWLDYQGSMGIWVLLGVALTHLLVQRCSHTTSVFKGYLLPVVSIAVFALVSYSALKSLLAHLFPHEPSLRVVAFGAEDIWVITLFTALAVLSWLLRYQAHRPAMQKLSMILFAGLYLDEWLTRLTLKVWPVKLPKRSKAKVSATANNLQGEY